jgi:hypothetical protein
MAVRCFLLASRAFDGGRKGASESVNRTLPRSSRSRQSRKCDRRSSPWCQAPRSHPPPQRRLLVSARQGGTGVPAARKTMLQRIPGFRARKGTALPGPRTGISDTVWTGRRDGGPHGDTELTRSATGIRGTVRLPARAVPRRGAARTYRDFGHGPGAAVPGFEPPNQGELGHGATGSGGTERRRCTGKWGTDRGANVSSSPANRRCNFLFRNYQKTDKQLRRSSFTGGET